MTVQIDTTAENNALRLVNQGAHPSTPSVNHTLLYIMTGTNAGLYIETDTGQKIGPFITGSSATATPTPGFLGLYNFTAPLTTGWTWDNQGSSTGIFNASYSSLYFPKQNAVKLSGIYRTPTNATYAIEVAVLHDVSGVIDAGGVPGDGGLVFGFRDSGGKIVILAHQTSGGASWNIVTSKWTDSSNYNSNYTSLTNALLLESFPQVLFMKVVYDGTNIVFYKSLDGLVWYRFDIRTSTDFLAAGKPDVFIGTYINNQNIALNLVSWKETAV